MGFFVVGCVYVIVVGIVVVVFDVGMGGGVCWVFLDGGVDGVIGGDFF